MSIWANSMCGISRASSRTRWWIRPQENSHLLLKQKCLFPSYKKQIYIFAAKFISFCDYCDLSPCLYPQKRISLSPSFSLSLSPPLSVSATPAQGDLLRNSFTTLFPSLTIFISFSSLSSYKKNPVLDFLLWTNPLNFQLNGAECFWKLYICTTVWKSPDR